MRSLAGITASLALVALTITVFAKSELRGPEGAINRYFLALLNRDEVGAESAAFGTLEDFANVSNFFAGLLATGARYHVVDVMRSGSTARAGVIFYRDGIEEPYIIPLRRIGKEWRIDLARIARPHRFPAPGDEEQ